MIEITKVPYEISIWEDVLVFVLRELSNEETDVETIIETTNLEGYTNHEIIGQYYKEQKVAIIGSDTMNTPIAAFNITLNQDINGSNTLTFSMNSLYYDEDTEELTPNPFANLMVNERKVKIKYKDKWIDLVIKNIQESSQAYTFTYTAQDLFINELAKTGFNLQFDNELENNQGTITELAARILEESDWKLREGDGANDLLRQYKSEPLYKATIKDGLDGSDGSITAKKVINDSGDNTKPLKGTIYIFYSNLINKVENFFQFIHITGEANETIEIDDDHNITNGTLYYIDGVTFTEDNDINIPHFVENLQLTTQYRGERVVRNATTKYLNSIDKYVSVFKDTNDKEVYGFSETEYISAATTQNFITNPNGFTSFTGWEAESVTKDGDNITGGAQLSFTHAPSIFDTTADYPGPYYSYLTTTFHAAGAKVFNSGISDSRSLIENFTVGDKYRLIFKGSTTEPDKTNGEINLISTADFGKMKFVVSEYTLADGKYTLTGTPYLIFKPTELEYTEFILGEKIVEEKTTSDPNVLVGFKSGTDLNLKVGDKIWFQVNLQDIQTGIIKEVKEEEVSYTLAANSTFDSTLIYYIFNASDATYSKVENPSADNINSYYTKSATYVYTLSASYDAGTAITTFKISKEELLDGYQIATATSAVTVPYEELILKKIGFFIESAESKTYYIEDIQLFKELTDGTGAVIYPDTIPEPVIKTKYFFFDPEQLEGISSIDELSYLYSGYDEPTEYTLTYSTNYEKVRSITASESNRFNLIQTLCETFECWAKFEVEHDKETGRILLEKDVEGGDIENPYRQRKFVSFKEVVGKTNYAGFKNGINLQSTQRTLASEGIVSKLIVKNNSNEFAESGFCTIARASENPSGENFILNFDYYVSQGLIDLDTVMNDLYLDTNGYIGYYKKLGRINKDREENANLQADLNNDISVYESELETYELGLASIEERIIELKEEMVTLTGSTYEQVVEAVSGYKVLDQSGNDITTSALKEKFLKDKYGAEALNIYIAIVQSQASRLQYQKNCEFYQDLLYGYYFETADTIPLKDSVYYERIDTDAYIEETEPIEELLSEYYELIERQEKYIKNEEPYIEGADYYELTPGNTYEPVKTLDPNKIYDYYKLVYVDVYKKTEDTELVENKEYYRFYEAGSYIVVNFDFSDEVNLPTFTEGKTYYEYNKGCYGQLAELESLWEEKLQEKTALDKQFYQKYSRFIQEGSWISEDYVDDNLYYLDAESTLYTSAYPQISYNFSVIDLQTVEEYAAYTFELGDKTYVEDTEFFGWIIKNGMKTPRQEEIVVTNISYGIDDPTKTNITVKNYKTQFEDLFQRITATTQSVQFSTGEYNRATTILTSQGTIDTNILQSSLFNNNVALQNVKNESVTWDESGITSVNLAIPAQIIRITSGGLFVSNDGGESWSTGVTADGINANFITAGQIDVSKINILNGMQKTFRWDKQGINAYTWADDGTYNLNNFVRFDQFGIYGIRGNENFNPQEDTEDREQAEQKIWDNAQFALTWKGFMLKSDENSGYISISSDNDFQVFANGNERIKIGRLDSVTATLAETESPMATYGIRIKGANNATVMVTKDDGSLWLEDRLNIGTDNPVGIGNLGNPDSEHKNQIINANNNFIVYEDGHVKATGAGISGVITATGGSIGNLSITEEGLTATTDNGNLSLTDEGLTLTNNLFEIKDSKGNSLLKFDPNEQDAGLQLATGGTFEGTIKATAGNIGGFIITETELYSSEKRENEESPTAANASIVLNGTNGLIKAESISIGKRALIEDFIKLGNAYICNPEKHNGVVIKVNPPEGDNSRTVGKIELSQTGELLIGADFSKIGGSGGSGGVPSGKYWRDFTHILLDGKNGSVFSGNYVGGASGWKIDSEVAEFNNVVARGAIKASVFEYGEIQSVGGAIVVRPSSIIRDASNADGEYTLTLENTNDFSAGDICQMQIKYGNAISTIYCNVTEKVEGSVAIKVEFLNNIGPSIESLIGKPIINLGPQNQKNVGIVLNSSTNTVFGVARGLGIFESDYSDSKLNITPSLVLGDLDENRKIGDIETVLGKRIGSSSNYGLYAENVILHGSLTTSLKDGTEQYYSGIGTNSSVKETAFAPNENGDIIFWGGAAVTQDTKGNREINIANAPFRVDSRGNLYARNGLFEGSIISNSTITASELQVATITGYENGQDAALTIQDTEYGINFRTAVDQEDIESYEPADVTNGFIEGVEYYEQQDGNYVLTEDTTPEDGKTYYTKLISNTNNYVSTFSVKKDIVELNEVENGLVLDGTFGLRYLNDASVGELFADYKNGNNLNSTKLELSENSLNVQINNAKYVNYQDQKINHLQITDFQENGFQMTESVVFKKTFTGVNIYVI